MLTAVVVLHVALLALFLQQSVKVAPVVKPTSVAAFTLAAERPAAAEPPPPALPAKLADTFKPIVEFSIPTDAESDSPAGATGACSTAGAVLDALLLDPVAIAAIRNAPRETRSITDAIVMWNEGWTPASLTPDTPLFSVRAAIERSLSAVKDGCLDEVVVGPRLLPVPGAAEMTIFVVLGSGKWTWRALLDPATMIGVDGAVPAAVSPTPAP